MTARPPKNRGSKAACSRDEPSVVLVTDNDPWDVPVSVVGTDGWDGTELASLLVEDAVGISAVGVDGTNQTVLRNVLEVTSVLEPWSTGRDVVGRAFTLGLDQDWGLDDVLAVPSLEWLEQLQSVGRWADGDLNRGTIGRWGLESVLSWVVSLWWQLKTSWLGELELFAIGALEGVGQGVEGEVTGEDEGGD